MNSSYNATGGMSPDPSFEQFAEPETRHEFSAKYRERRQALIREAARASGKRRLPIAPKAAPRLTWRAAAAAAVCIAVPAAAWAAASHADFFSGAFGTGWRESQAAEQSYQQHDGEKPSTPVVYPASDVVQLDAEAAEALLGDAVCDEPLTVSAPDGHVLAIASAVRSENALAYRFTLHRDGGVTCLHWDEHTNNVAAKGAYAPPDAQFSWTAAGDEFVYVDPTASTDDTIVGYAYSVFDKPIPDGQPVSLTAYTCDVPFDHDFEEGQFHEQSYEIPCTRAVASTTFENAEGSAVALSPLGLTLNCRGLFAQPDDEDGYDLAQDPVNIRSVVVKMSDGDAYTVFDNAANLDNMLSACGFDTILSVAFNRLVDPARVVAIEVAATDPQALDDLRDSDGDWPTDANWPVRSITYTLP